MLAPVRMPVLILPTVHAAVAPPAAHDRLCLLLLRAYQYCPASGMDHARSMGRLSEVIAFLTCNTKPNKAVWQLERLCISNKYRSSRQYACYCNMPRLRPATRSRMCLMLHNCMSASAAALLHIPRDATHVAACA
jgi:hypothetical protein